MADKDLISNIAAEEVLAETTIGTDTTTLASIHDNQGFMSLSFLINLTSVTDGSYTIQVTEGDDPGLSDGVLAAADRLLGTLTFDTVDAGKMLRVGYVGHKRFARLEIVSTGTSTGAVLDVKAIDGHPLEAAVANPSN